MNERRLFYFNITVVHSGCIIDGTHCGTVGYGATRMHPCIVFFSLRLFY